MTREEQHETLDARWEELAMKAVDGFLTSDERQELDALLSEHPERRAELEDFMDIKSTTDGLAARIRADAQIELPRESERPDRLFSALGMWLIIGGWFALTAYAITEILADPSQPGAIRVGVALCLGGCLVLLGIVGRTRWRARKTDPYRHIDL